MKRRECPRRALDLVVALEREILSRQEYRLIAGMPFSTIAAIPSKRHGHVTGRPNADVPIEEVDLRQ